MRDIVDFFDSPFSKVIANPDYINKVKDIASNRLNTVKNTPLSKGMNIELRTWNKFRQGKYIRSLTYSRLSKFCNLSSNESRKGIKFIDNIEDPNIPLKFNSKAGARLDVGIFNEGRMRDRGVDYSNKDLSVLSKVLESSRKVIGIGFKPTIGIDKRNDTRCIYFPPYMAKHYVKLGFSEQNKNSSNLRIPPYIMNNEALQKIWWQGNLSEEASLHPHAFVHKNKYGPSYFLYPRIQINRAKKVSVNFKISNKRVRLYHQNIPKNILNKLKKEKHSLIEDEGKILKNLDIDFKSYFANLYINNKNSLTAAYSLLIYKMKSLEKWSEIGFELNRQKKQFKLLLNGSGTQSKEGIRDIFIKYYELFPYYLRGNKKIMQNKWLLEEDKKELLKNVKTTNNRICGSCRSRKI